MFGLDPDDLAKYREKRAAALKTTFLIDYRDSEGLKIAVLDAFGVYTTENGDLLFYDEKGEPFDMWAAGHWLRCKIGKAL